MSGKMQLIENIDRVHTTELGILRIRKNLELETENVVDVCKKIITDPAAVMERKGKNWYVHKDDCVIVVNAHSYTIITAHKTI